MHPDDELLPAAYALGPEIADNTSAVSVALTRQMLWRMLGESHPMEAHRVDSAGIDYMGALADAREGVRRSWRSADPRSRMRPSTDMPAFYPWWTDPEF